MSLSLISLFNLNPSQQLHMQRRPILYVLNLIFPTSALFILDMVISCTYVSSSEKINFKITLILEVSVLSLILNEILPTSSDDPPVIGNKSARGAIINAYCKNHYELLPYSVFEEH